MKTIQYINDTIEYVSLLNRAGKLTPDQASGLLAGLEASKLAAEREQGELLRGLRIAFGGARWIDYSAGSAYHQSKEILEKYDPTYWERQVEHVEGDVNTFDNNGEGDIPQ